MMPIHKESFGCTSEGIEVYKFTISNVYGNKVVLTNYGVIIISLILKDSKGNDRDLILGYDDLKGYEDNHPMFGATVGRNVNRIKNAMFTIDGVEYHLKKNRGNHNIHSDKDHGFHKVVWDYEIIDSHSITFHYISPDMEQEFPGEMETSITYTFTDTNTLIVSYRSISNKRTLINLTNHAYFNLGGHDSGDILNTEIMICADKFTPVDAELIPTGEITSVGSKPMDFREPKKIADVINREDKQLHYARGFDHNFVIDYPDVGIRRMAEAADSETGIKMTIYSDLPGMQFYTGNSLKETVGKGGHIYKQNSGFCMEPQYFPNSINISNFKAPIYDKDEEYKTTTIYQFNI